MLTVYPVEYKVDRSLGLEDFRLMVLHRFNRLYKIFRDTMAGEALRPLGQQGWCVARVVQVVAGKRTRLVLDSPLSRGSHTFPLYTECEGLVEGLVLCFKIQRARITEVRFPELRNKAPFKTEGAPRYLACVSDLHIGSVHFAAAEFQGLVKYLNERDDVDMLLVAGDLIDGCGVFQNQVSKQELKTFNQQLNRCARLLKLFDRRIHLLIGPGNHDNRDGRLEPQPEIRVGTLPFPPNVTFLTNPCRLTLENGLKILYDHGTGLGHCIDKLGFLSYDNVGDGMKYLLKNRHLAPLLSAAVPGPVDVKVVQQEPHLFVAGHVHKWSASFYRGTLCLNCGTFQNPAAYVTLLGIVPDVAIVTLINMNDVTDVIKVTFVGDSYKQQPYVCV